MLSQTIISPTFFADYAQRHMVKSLQFPNGHMWKSGRGDVVPTELSLHTMYDAMVRWTVNGEVVLHQEILATIVFGSAVRVPKQLHSSYKQFCFFGKTLHRTEAENITVHDIDILVITQASMTKELIIPTRFVTIYGSPSGPLPLHPGLDMVHRGIEQIRAGSAQGDTVSANALKDGVIIMQHEEWPRIHRTLGIAQETPYAVWWNQDADGKLYGIIR